MDPGRDPELVSAARALADAIDARAFAKRYVVNMADLEIISYDETLCFAANGTLFRDDAA